MTDKNLIETIACPIGEVLISRVFEIQEMMDDYKQTKANQYLKGQEVFSKEQVKIYEEQFESCIDDLLTKLDVAEKALVTLANPTTTLEATNENRKMINEALAFLRK